MQFFFFLNNLFSGFFQLLIGTEQLLLKLADLLGIVRPVSIKLGLKPVQILLHLLIIEPLQELLNEQLEVPERKGLLGLSPLLLALEGLLEELEDGADVLVLEVLEDELAGLVRAQNPLLGQGLLEDLLLGVPLALLLLGGLLGLGLHLYHFLQDRARLQLHRFDVPVQGGQLYLHSLRPLSFAQELGFEFSVPLFRLL